MMAREPPTTCHVRRSSAKKLISCHAELEIQENLNSQGSRTRAEQRPTTQQAAKTIVQVVFLPWLSETALFPGGRGRARAGVVKNKAPGRAALQRGCSPPPRGKGKRKHVVIIMGALFPRPHQATNPTTAMAIHQHSRFRF